MPCNDVTEAIEIVFDRRERLKSYALRKKTCGGAVGLESFLFENLGGKTIAELTAIDDFSFLQSMAPLSDVEEFLTLKHLFALQAAVFSYIGHDGQIGQNACTILDVVHDDDETVVYGEIDVKLVTEMIKSCEHCGPG